MVDRWHRSSRFKSPSTAQNLSASLVSGARCWGTSYRTERDQSCAFGLKCSQALFTHEPGADPHVKMQPILDDLAFGNALEEQSRAHPCGINACER